jgi:hypothetical protein
VSGGCDPFVSGEGVEGGGAGGQQRLQFHQELLPLAKVVKGEYCRTQDNPATSTIIQECVWGGVGPMSLGGKYEKEERKRRKIGRKRKKRNEK